MLEYLEARPLPVRIIERLEDEGGPLSGRYDPRTRTIQIAVQRGGGLSKKLTSKNWGDVERVSDVAPSLAVALQKTLAHELSHDLLWRWAEQLGGFTEVEARVRPVFKAGQPASMRAKFSWREYFCEAHVAYIYHGPVLKQLDPLGYGIVEEVRRALELKPLW